MFSTCRKEDVCQVQLKGEAFPFHANHTADFGCVLTAPHSKSTEMLLSVPMMREIFGKVS